MPEPAAGPGLGSGADAPAQLLATKLFTPRLRPRFVSRPRLVDALDAGLGRGLVLISAPPGFGKTALLADWSSRRPVAWLSLDAADNDPARFWRHAIAALDRVRPGIAERVAPLLGAQSPPAYEGLVTGLINALAGEPGRGAVVLVLDDYHVIDALAVHESLMFLLAHRPPDLRVVLTSRADPPLRWAGLRADGQLAELRAADLRFTRDEAAALLHQAVDGGLPADSVAELADRTEGWAAGLQLAALALQGRSDVAGFVTTFSGSHRYILDYLTEEVLERQTDEIRAFLLQTSILERLSGDLCDAVTGRTDGRAMLTRIDQANLFLIPLDDVRGWWRYHHLFADLLRARLQMRWPGRIPELHARAAAWYERAGLPDDAIGHAMAAGDPEWAARLIERQVGILLLRREGVTLRSWLSALPDEQIASRPRLLLAQADMALGSGGVEAVERALDAAERAFEDGDDEPLEPATGPASFVANVPAAIAFWRAYLAELSGDAEHAIALDRQALAELGDEQSLLAAAARLHLRSVELMSGTFVGAEQGLAASFAELHAAGEIYPALRACELLGHVQRARGRLDAAAGTYREGLEIATVPGGPAPPAAGIAHVGLAEVAYQRDDLAGAAEHATEGVALCRLLTYSRSLDSGLAILARIKMAEGDLDGALDVTEGYRRVVTSRGVTNLLDTLPALRARLLLAWGDLAAVVRWTRERGLHPDDDVVYPRESEHLVLARLLLTQDQPDAALALLDRLHALASEQGRTGSVIEVGALHAVVMAAAGDHDGAVATLAEALTLAHPEGYVRVFADEGAPMGDLLGRLVTAQRGDPTVAADVPVGYLARLLHAMEHDDDPSSPTHGTGIPGLVEALTERELEVLRQVAAGRSNRQISRELYVALDTVKKHVSHILRKLGAANRTEATARARELGLLRTRE